MQHNPDIDLKTTGPYTGSWIPWMGGMNLLEKYAKSPDIPLPLPPNVGCVSYDLVKAQLGEWKPDIVLSIDAGITWTAKPSDGFSATIATDPHALNYDHQRRISDKFFNMQLFYSEPGDIYLPYAYSKYDHYPEDIANPDDAVDAVLIGMPYPQRIQWVDELRKHGVSVVFENGPVYDEARAAYNRGKIGLNWSSLNDLNARVFEIPAMNLYPVMNRVPDMGRFEFLSYVDTFSSIAEAVERVVWAKGNPDKARIVADHAHRTVQGETYDARVEQFLKECGM